MCDRDPCLKLVESHASSLDPDLALQFLVQFTGVTKKTPPERILRAVAEEVSDLEERALAAIDGRIASGVRSPLFDEARQALRHALDSGSVADDATPEQLGKVRFPRQELEALLARSDGAPPSAAGSADDDRSSLQTWIARHRALERRLHWLLGGTRPEEIPKLDPVADSDRIMHATSSGFRVETRILETIVINRIAQAAPVALFFRSTREAETNPVFRFYDTFALLANFFEWGADSKRGRETVARLNRIHGRYYTPNDGMKYVLLQTAFTWLDGADRIGHRSLFDIERQAYFHSFVRLGRAMNIAEMTEDYAAMYAWYEDFNRANAEPAPLKTDTFETVFDNSFAAVPSAQLRRAMHLACRVAMDDTYRRALGYAHPTAQEVSGVRSTLFTLGNLVATLPSVPFVRSLQNNPARTNYVRPSDLGVSKRSDSMPVVDAAQPNGGYPEHQVPIASETDVRPMNLPSIDWRELRKHDHAGSLWVAIDGIVYDLTSWAQHHPGGLDVLMEVAGGDATKAFGDAKHSAATHVFMLNYRIGRVATPQPMAQYVAQTQESR